MIFLEKPWIHGGCVGTSGQVLTIWPKQTPCFLCIVPEPPPLGSVITCDRAGVLGSATAIVAALQVTAALRVLVAPDATKTGHMVCVDVWNSTFKTIDTMPLRGTACPACQQGKLSFLEMTDSQQPVPLCGQNAVQLPPLGSGKAVSLPSIARDLESPENPIQLTAFFLRIHHGIYRITIFKDGRGVVEGTEDPAIARSIWHQVLGV
jgi:adenylyltransferase/sulfurtransferase